MLLFAYSCVQAGPKYKQDRHYTYNITMTSVCVANAAMKEKKAINIKYSECLFVVLGIQHAMRMRRTVICGLPGSTIFFFHIIS